MLSARSLLLAVVLAVLGSGVVVPSAQAETYSAPLRTAVADLRLGTEVRAGYDRDLFRHWVDADRDGCSTREEVLISEADDPVTVGSGCSLRGGRWFSYYDRVSWTATSRIDIDHLVPLAEAWDSGARSWRAATRERFANDLGDRRSLVGVTDSVNQSKGDQDVAEWLPRHGRCRYVAEWVAVKHRWRLRVDRAEKAALRSLAAGCGATRVTVAVAR